MITGLVTLHGLLLVQRYKDAGQDERAPLQLSRPTSARLRLRLARRACPAAHGAREDLMPTDPGVDHDATRRTVMNAVRELDGPAVREALLRTLFVSGVDAAIVQVVMPVLRDVGDGWERGELGVLHEHFVSRTFRGVLDGLRMPLQGDQVRTVVLACPPHDLHDLPLELFGAMLHARWWRVVVLGPNTPMAAVGDAVRHLDADACVLAGVRRSAFESRLRSLSRLGERVPLFLAGEGALALPVPPAGVTVLPRDLLVAAAMVDAVAPSTTTLRAGRRNEPAVR